LHFVAVAWGRRPSHRDRNTSHLICCSGGGGEKSQVVLAIDMLAAGRGRAAGVRT